MSTGFIPNEGLWFKKPYESEYARCRRILFANPGIPFSSLLANQRLRRRAGEEDFATLGERHISYQCPRCAAELYHSPIFEFAWLTQCPLHGVPLTKRCPQCKKPWPPISELQNRDCATCGIPSWKDMTGSPLNRHNASAFANLQALYGFIHDFEKRPQFSIFDVPGLSVEVASPWFPSLHWQRHKSLPRDRLTELGIVLVPVHRIRGEIRQAHHRLDTDPIIIPYGRSEPKILHHWRHYQRLFHQTFQQVVAWIQQHAPPCHKIHLTPYSPFVLMDLVRRVPPCPFCMAFSLWVPVALAAFCGNAYIYVAHHLKLFDDFCAVGTIFTPTIPRLLGDPRGSQLYLSGHLGNWLIRRQLLYGFMQAFRFSECVLKRATALYPKPESDYIVKTTCGNMDLMKLTYSLNVQRRKVDFYFTEGLQLSKLAALPESVQAADECSWFDEHVIVPRAGQAYASYRYIITENLTWPEFEEVRQSVLNHLLHMTSQLSNRTRVSLQGAPL